MPSLFYNSISEMLDAAKPFAATWRTDKDISWLGGTPESVLDYARTGWKEGAQKATELARKIVDRTIQASPQESLELGFDTSGCAFDIGAVLQGVPEAWGSFLPSQDKKVVSICVNTCVSAGIPASAMMTRGIAMTALALALQARGYIIEIKVGAQVQQPPFVSVWTTLASASSGSILDLDRIVMACAYPPFTRYWQYAVLSELVHDRYLACPSDANHPECDLYLGSAHLYDVQKWQDGGEAWILDEYKRQTQEAV